MRGATHRVPQAHWADVRVGLSTKLIRAAAEGFAVGAQLHVALYADHCLVPRLHVGQQGTVGGCEPAADEGQPPRDSCPLTSPAPVLGWVVSSTARVRADAAKWRLDLFRTSTTDRSTPPGTEKWEDVETAMLVRSHSGAVISMPLAALLSIILKLVIRKNTVQAQRAQINLTETQVQQA